MMFLHVSRKERLRNKQNKLPIERLIQIEIKKKKKYMQNVRSRVQFDRSRLNVYLCFVLVYVRVFLLVYDYI